MDCRQRFGAAGAAVAALALASALAAPSALAYTPSSTEYDDTTIADATGETSYTTSVYAQYVDDTTTYSVTVPSKIYAGAASSDVFDGETGYTFRSETVTPPAGSGKVTFGDFSIYNTGTTNVYLKSVSISDNSGPYKTKWRSSLGTWASNPLSDIANEAWFEGVIGNSMVYGLSYGSTTVNNTISTSDGLMTTSEGSNFLTPEFYALVGDADALSTSNVNLLNVTWTFGLTA